MNSDSSLKNSSNHADIAKSALLVTTMMLSFKILGFIKQSVIAYFFGATVETDTYFIAWGFIYGVSESVVSSLLVSLVAINTQLRLTKGREEASRLINGLLEILIPAFAVGALVIFFIAPYLTLLLAPSFHGESETLLITYIRLLAPILLFSTLELVFWAVMDSYKSFFIPRLKSLIYSLSVIAACFILVKSLGVNALVIAQYSSSIIYSLVLIIAVKKYHDFSFVKFKDIPELKNIIITAIPLFIGNSALHINQLIDKSLSSGLENGAVSALSYCHVLEQLVTNIMIVNIGNIMFANFAGFVVQGKIIEIKNILTTTLNIMIAFLAGVSIFIIFCARDIVSVVYQRGNFGYDAVKLTATALIGYALSFVAVAVKNIMKNSLFAFKDTKQPMIASIISICINIVLSVILSRFIGILGIALATSLSAVCEMTINSISIRKYLPDYNYKVHVHSFLKCFPAMILLTGVCILVARSIPGNAFLKVMLSALIGFPVYFAVLFMCKYAEIRTLWNIFLQKVVNLRLLKS